MIAQSFPRQRRRIPGKVPFYFRFVSKAYEGITRGNDIYFRPGVYDPSTIKGLAKLGHELVHVGQYRNGMTWAQYWWASRHEYDPNNQYEKPAYDKQDAIENTMTRRSVADAQSNEYAPCAVLGVLQGAWMSG